MEKPVYYDGDPKDSKPCETRTFEIKILINQQFVELGTDEKHQMYELQKRLQSILVSYLGGDYYPEVIEASRTTELDGDEHMPTLEHVLQYLRDKGEPETSRFIGQHTGALYRRVYGNQIW